MKRILTAVLLCLLALLCGCAKKPEAEPLAQEAVSVPAAAEPEIVPETAEPKPEASEPEPIPDGIVTINGRAIYYQNGQPLAGTGLTELDGQLLYVQPDGSLFSFSHGVNRCGDTLYYQTGEDGFALLPPPVGLYDDGQALYDVQPDDLRRRRPLHQRQRGAGRRDRAAFVRQQSGGSGCPRDTAFTGI